MGRFLRRLEKKKRRNRLMGFILSRREKGEVCYMSYDPKLGFVLVWNQRAKMEGV